MRTQLPSPKGDRAPISAHFYCGQMAVCIRIPLYTEVGLSLGDIVLDGDPAHPPLKGHAQPRNFRPMSVVAKRLDGLTLGMEVSLGPGDCVPCMGTQLPPEKKAHPHPILPHIYCGHGRPSQLLLMIELLFCFSFIQCSCFWFGAAD